jgi:hypothetical protein
VSGTFLSVVALVQMKELENIDHLITIGIFSNLPSSNLFTIKIYAVFINALDYKYIVLEASG